MAKLRAIKRRIAAVKATGSVMRTMSLISALRFRQAHKQLVAARPYLNRLSAVGADFIRNLPGEISGQPLLRDDPEPRRNALLIIAGNRGLCGSYNNNVIRLAMERRKQLLAAHNEVLIYSAGRKAADPMRRAGLDIHRDVTLAMPPAFEASAALGDEFIEDFLAGRISGLEVAYTNFISTGRQRSTIAQVLPLAVMDVAALEAVPPGASAVYDAYPHPAELLEELLPLIVKLRVHQCFLEAAVSEHLARMRSMQAATDNADELLHTLTTKYNHMRQARITTELSEIMGGRAQAKEGRS